ncbi:MAG: hypothetical protein L6R39_000588 [Caloplaca ligustica]|nr:MAG: hypothetical protein L6R39_000588 [Caloplaca ligustica]
MTSLDRSGDDADAYNKRSFIAGRDSDSTEDCPHCPNREVPFRLPNGQCTCIHLKGERADVAEKREASIRNAESSERERGLETRHPICANNCRYMEHAVRRYGKCTCEPVPTGFLKKRQAKGADPATLVNSPWFKVYWHFNPTQAQLYCVVYKQCVEGQAGPVGDLRGTVSPVGDCECKPKKVGRDIFLTDKQETNGDLSIPGQPSAPGMSLSERDNTNSLITRHNVAHVLQCANDKKCSRFGPGWHGMLVGPGDLNCVCVHYKRDLPKGAESMKGINVKAADLRNVHPTSANCAYKSCSSGQHAIITSSGACKCIADHRKRQDVAGCENFSCPLGFMVKLNGTVCYCGQDGDFPYPQGPASLGPSGGSSTESPEDSSSNAVNLDGDWDEEGQDE